MTWICILEFSFKHHLLNCEQCAITLYDKWYAGQFTISIFYLVWVQLFLLLFAPVYSSYTFFCFAHVYHCCTLKPKSACKLNVTAMVVAFSQCKSENFTLDNFFVVTFAALIKCSFLFYKPNTLRFQLVQIQFLFEIKVKNIERI